MGGALAGLASSLALHPVDTLKSRMLAGRWEGPRAIIPALRYARRRHGLPALYRGFGAVALFTTPANALYFGCYEAREFQFLVPVECGSFINALCCAVNAASKARPPASAGPAGGTARARVQRTKAEGRPVLALAGHGQRQPMNATSLLF